MKQRLLSLLVFAVFGALVWVAGTGRYDRQVGQVAHWMKTHWDALVH